MVALQIINNQYLDGDASLACSPDMQADIDNKVIALAQYLYEN